MIEGWYYLHVNGDLIYKADTEGQAADIRDSDLALALWPFDPSDREGAWQIIVESLAAGARPGRVADLAAKWGCTDNDGQIYAERLGIKIGRDGNQWYATRADFVNLQESPAGFGTTICEALSALAKDLGYSPSKLWGAHLSDLVKV